MAGKLTHRETVTPAFSASGFYSCLCNLPALRLWEVQTHAFSLDLLICKMLPKMSTLKDCFHYYMVLNM